MCFLRFSILLPDSHSLIWTIGASGKKSLLGDVFWLWQRWLKTVPSHPLATLPLAPSTCYCRKCWYYRPLEWADCGQVLQTPLRVPSSSALAPWVVVLVSGLGSQSSLSFHGLETCYHISHVCCIQMLGSKLGSELSPNHLSFSVNGGTQLPAQLLRYFELQLYVLAGISVLLLSVHARKKQQQSKDGKWCIDSILVTLSWRKYFFVYIWGQKISHSDFSLDWLK